MNEKVISTDNMNVKNIFKGKKILIVEDDLFSFEILAIYLEETKVEIIHAIDGLQAVEVCQKNQDVNLILMDINLPKLDGLSATKQIKKFRPNLPVIAQTGNAMPEDIVKSKDAGCIYHISKPVKENDLLLRVAKYII